MENQRNNTNLKSNLLKLIPSRCRNCVLWRCFSGFGYKTSREYFFCGFPDVLVTPNEEKLFQQFLWCWSPLKLPIFLSTCFIVHQIAVGMQNPALSSFSISAAFPHPVKQDEITIPRSLLYIIVSSIFISFLLLIVSLLDLGYCSLWLTPPLCLFTLLYFTGVLVLSRMERTIEEPTYFPTVVFVGYIMTIIWLVSFILTVIVFAAYPHMVDALRQQGLHTASVGLQRFQCLLCMTNLGLVGGFTARSHVIAMEEGDPENWRILIEKTQNPAANVSAILIFSKFHCLNFKFLASNSSPSSRLASQSHPR